VKVVVDMKRFFYDRAEVEKKLEKKRLEALRNAGGFTRKVARRSLRKRKRVSKPKVETPSIHTSSSTVTLKNIQFGFDTDNEAAIVGPVGLSGMGNEPPAPGVLEHGERVTRRNERRTERVVGKVGEIALDEVREVTTKTGKVRRIKLRKKGSSTREVVDYKGKKRRVTYALIRTDEQARRANEINEELYGPTEIVGNVQERPFMEPAVELAAVEFPDLYLKGG